MARHQLVIAPAAKNDLKDIYQYGLRQWGKVQSESYLSTIKNQFWLLTQQPLIGTERPELLPDTRVEIIRVLHGRQDPQRHLK
ncbi:MAG: type II toxin-antitoxin system RelE/ParE family toxin [Chromatiaceae bacterium]|nr:type II toxin-antitoxin system RelE/ParE family toxin [Chromatiaceae bacterium]